MPNLSMSIDTKTSTKAGEGLFFYHVRLIINLATLFSPESSIINISSMYGKVSPDPSIYLKDNEMNPLLYGSLKAALIQSTKYLSSIFSCKGIRVNSVSYGPFLSQKVIQKSRIYKRIK